MIDDFPNVQFIRLPKNFGLTKALNLGWRAADAEYVFFLHDDTESQPAAIGILADALDTHADAAAVCPLLVDAEGQPAPQLGSLPPDRRVASRATRRRPAGGGIPARRGPHAARLFHQGDPPDRRALRPVRQRCRPRRRDPPRLPQDPAGARRARAARGPRQLLRLETADFLVGRAVFLGKYQGFGAGLQARMAAVSGSLAGFRFGELKYTIAGQKIDGTQE